MKFARKCAYCSRRADTRWRGEHFCNDCKKFMRRKKITAFMGKERIVGAIPGTAWDPKPLLIYRDIPVYLK